MGLAFVFVDLTVRWFCNTGFLTPSLEKCVFFSAFFIWLRAVQLGSTLNVTIVFWEWCWWQLGSSPFQVAVTTRSFTTVILWRGELWKRRGSDQFGKTFARMFHHWTCLEWVTTWKLGRAGCWLLKLKSCYSSVGIAQIKGFLECHVPDIEASVLVLGFWMTMGDAKTVQSHYSKSGVF